VKGEPWTCAAIITTQIPDDTQSRAIAHIPLRALQVWLATIVPRWV
jgi:hypothetical protein